MISPKKAEEIVLAAAVTKGIESVSIFDAWHRVLAEKVLTDMDMPPFDKSAMDGYACRKQDKGGCLRVVEVVAAGQQPSVAVEPGTCVKIMTGAPIPAKADCVVQVEYSKQVSENKILFEKTDERDHICYRGEDVKSGEILLQPGILLQPEHIAVLAMCGYQQVQVYQKPTVGIISTGNELVEPDMKPSVCQIRNTNAYQLYAQVIENNAIPLYYGIVTDQEKATWEILKKATEENDIVLITGGVSMGDFDFVPKVIAALHFETAFQQIAVQPGKPTLFAVKENRYIFGLPGNPVSSFIQFESLVAPLLYRLQNSHYLPEVVSLPLKKDYQRKRIERTAWIPCVIATDREIETVDYHGSAHISSLTRIDGFFIMEAGIDKINKGTIINVRLI